MNRFLLFCGLFALCLKPIEAFGHGAPIVVHVSNGQLAISNGLNLSSGFVSMVNDYHEDGYLQLAPGNTQGTDLPGFDVNDVETNSQLLLEVIPRPDFTDPAAPLRWLWHWDKTTQQTAVAPNDPFVRMASKRGFGDVRVTQFTAPTTLNSVQILEPKASDIGTHQHALNYFLDDSPAAEFGAYGVFVRLTSPNYEPSEPFLIVLNHSLSGEEYVTASRQINAAAGLPGDYDHNDVVNGADFLVWQRTLGSTTNLAADSSLNGTVDADDLVIWKQSFGSSWPPSAVIATPEPATFALLAWSVLAMRLRRTRGTGSA